MKAIPASPLPPLGILGWVGQIKILKFLVMCRDPERQRHSGVVQYGATPATQEKNQPRTVKEILGLEANIFAPGIAPHTRNGKRVA